MRIMLVECDEQNVWFEVKAIECDEQNVWFEVKAIEVQPTEEERKTAWGLRRLTAEGRCAADGMTCRWYQTEEIVRPPWTDMKDEDLEEWGKPAMDALVFHRWGPCKVGNRFPVLTEATGQSIIDFGDLSCEVRVVG